MNGNETPFEGTGIVAPQEAGQIGHIRHIVGKKKNKV